MKIKSCLTTNIIVVVVLLESEASKLARHLGCHILPTCMPTGFE